MTHQLDHYRLLGRSGLRVSPLSLGTMTFGVTQGWGSTPADAEAMFKLYADRGGNFIDTANFYADGDSERTIAALVRGQRNRFVIATKYSLTMRRGDPNASGNQRKNMMQAVEDSLRRLETDHIDLLYLHVWDSRTPVEEILRAFDDLVRAGKILYVGVSDLPAWQASRMQAIAELRGWTPLVALQIPYSLIERTVERELMPMALEMGMGVTPWSPLGGGVLTGKYQATDLKPPGPGVAMDSRKGINMMTGRLSERSLTIASIVGTIAQELNCTPAQVALAWTLLNPIVTSPILGARTATQLQDNLGALEIRFSEDQVARLNSVSHVEPGFPQTMLQGPAMEMMFGGVKVAPRRGNQVRTD